MYQNPLHTELHSGVLRGKATIVSRLDAYENLQMVSCCHIAPVHIRSQFNDLLKSVYDRLVCDSFPGSHLTGNEYRALTIACSVIFTCLHTHSSSNPLPSSSLASNVSVSSYPGPLHVLSPLPTKLCRLWSLSPPGLYLNPFG